MIRAVIQRHAFAGLRRKDCQTHVLPCMCLITSKLILICFVLSFITYYYGEQYNICELSAFAVKFFAIGCIFHIDKSPSFFK
jgi:hypothetical protein